MRGPRLMREEVIRSTVLHTTGDPSVDASRFVAIDDGAIVIADGRIRACGEFSRIRTWHPEAIVTDWRGGYVVPGFVDTHVHLPQLPVLGRLGWSLLEWLERAALPEEVRMADRAHAERTADAFVHALASHGTTTASVFGAHFAPAVAMLFAAAERAGLRVASGLVVSDRRLDPALHISADRAYRESTDLIRHWHGRGRALYSVTPRFALSTTSALLEVCQTLLAEHPTVRCQTHLNEQQAEVAEVAALFPDAADYLAVYERYGLSGPRAIMAHNVRATMPELERLAAAGTTVAHCPASNAALGSGIFPFYRHRAAGVRCALGTDVGGGTGFGMMKEALDAYLFQRVAAEPITLTPADLLYLATRAGAEALALEGTIGDFGVGKAADLVCLKPHPGSVLAQVTAGAADLAQVTAALFTLAGQESIREVRVDGLVVYRAEAA